MHRRRPGAGGDLGAGRLRVGALAAGPRVALADGPGTPVVSPHDALGRLGLTAGGPLVLGWTTDPAQWLDRLGPGSATALMGGFALRPHVERGAVTCLPVRLASAPRLLAGTLRPDVTVVRGVPRGSGFCFAESVSWGPVAARSARTGVVVLVEDGAPDLGTPMVEGRVLGVVDTAVARHDEPPRVPDEPLKAIARLVCDLLPDQPTLQTGPGAVGDAVLAELAGVEAPVRAWTGLATDALAELADRGLVRGPAVATYLAGGARVRAMAAEGLLRVLPIEETHDPGALHRLPRFVAVNTALQVGLDGSVNVETIDGRHVSGIGGHPDFCAAAAANPEGLSVIALRSEHSGRSTVVPRVESVSTPGCDVDMVVTEHGIADLRGADRGERARRISAVAAPSDREELLRVGR